METVYYCVARSPKEAPFNPIAELLERETAPVKPCIDASPDQFPDDTYFRSLKKSSWYEQIRLLTSDAHVFVYSVCRLQNRLTVSVG